MSASERHIRARHLPAARRRTPGPPIGSPARSPEVPADARNVIEFRNVCMHYPAGDIGLDGATFNVRRGEFLFIVGSTGSGKSTIMRLLIKEREPTAGSIRVAGRNLHELEHSKVAYYRRNIGVVFQDFKLLPNRTVYDNVAYALSATGARRKEIRSKVPDVLRLTGLSTKLHNFPDQLSGGEQQRVAVARAFVNHPPLLLADEPTGNLDPHTSLGIMQLLYRIYRAGTTVLVATHDSHMVDRMRRRVIELQGGRIIRDEASGLYAQGEQTTAEFGDMLDHAYGQLGRDQPTGLDALNTRDQPTGDFRSSGGGDFRPPADGGFRNY
jgi:cell division transport system ATP-binding protein